MPGAWAISVSDKSWVESMPTAPPATKARTIDSQAIRRSREFVPLRISSIKNRTGFPDPVQRSASRSLSASARNLDFSLSNESEIELEAQIVKQLSRALAALTGAPARARTVFTPTAFRNVLLPAIFDPLTT